LLACCAAATEVINETHGHTVLPLGMPSAPQQHAPMGHPA
jgi:hypothetical protein